MQQAEKTIDYFAQYGPWAVLAVLILAAVGWAAWKIYTRMANALDAMHAQTVKMAEDHASDIKLRDDRIIGVVSDCTKAFTMIGERMTGVEERLGDVESAVRGAKP